MGSAGGRAGEVANSPKGRRHRGAAVSCVESVVGGNERTLTLVVATSPLTGFWALSSQWDKCLDSGMCWEEVLRASSFPVEHVRGDGEGSIPARSWSDMGGEEGPCLAPVLRMRK